VISRPMMIAAVSTIGQRESLLTSNTSATATISCRQS